MALSMPGANFGILAWVALIPLFFAIAGKEPVQAFKLAFVAGAVFGIIEFHWTYALWDWISVGVIGVHIVLAIYFGLSWGIFGWLCAYFQKRQILGSKLTNRILLLFLVPTIWVLLEFGKSLSAFAFPWGQVADALYGQLPMIQISAITGVWGVSFLVVFTSFALFLALRNKSWKFAGLAFVIVGMVFAGGTFRMNAAPLAEGNKISLALVQPNVKQVIRTNPAYMSDFYQIYEDAFDEIESREEPVDLVVLPESSLPTFILGDGQARQFFGDWAEANQTPILLGTFVWDNGKIHNSVAFFSTEGPIEQVYKKVQLVPFSTEYFPGIGLLNQLGLSSIFPMAARLGGITPGDNFNPLLTDLGAIATPVCFETIFPHVSREFSKTGQAIISVTNDAWFKNTWALPQHFSRGVFRAVENGRYFVQAANSGISGVVGPYGKIKARSRIEDRAVIYSSISLIDENTFYTKYGDLFITIIGVFFSIILSASLLLGGRSRSQESSIV